MDKCSVAIVIEAADIELYYTRTMNTYDDISLQWAVIDDDGLVRVVNTDSFKSGFALIAQIGVAADELGYYPVVTLATDKVTLTIPFDDDGRAHRLAHMIDDTLGDATDS